MVKPNHGSFWTLQEENRQEEESSQMKSAQRHSNIALQMKATLKGIQQDEEERKENNVGVCMSSMQMVCM